MALTRTAVVIVGGGPAGLMLSHLLHRAGVESVVVDNRSRTQIEHTVRAGILEPGSVDLLTGTGVGDRVLREGFEHEGISLRFDGVHHRVDFKALAGASVWLYPQTDVFADLADARARDGGDVRFGVRDTVVTGAATSRPGIRFTGADGRVHEVRGEYLVGADGSRSICRQEIPQARRRHYFREYPFAWFGIIARAPRSSAELVYAHSERGFALISQRTEALQRMYFQCAPQADTAQWPEDRIWQEMQARVAGEDGFRLREGPILEKSVLRFRSFVAEPMRWGRLLLAGDAAHTVPPTGAKGLNLALADAAVLAEMLADAVRRGDDGVLDGYGPRALARVWRAQHFSYWMTTMLHTAPGGNPFDVQRQLGELRTVTSSEAGSRLLAEGYTGRPAATGV